MAQLQEDDIQRIRRLSEEARSRLLEIAVITARAAGTGLGEKTVNAFVPAAARKRADSDAGADAGGDWTESMTVNGYDACYGVSGGVPFAESPCGASATAATGPVIELG